MDAVGKIDQILPGEEKTPQNPSQSKLQLKRTKVKTGLDPLNIMKAEKEQEKRLEKERKIRKLSGDPGLGDNLTPTPTPEGPSTTKITEDNSIKTGNLNTLSDFISSDTKVPLKKDGTFEYETKIESIKGDFFTDKNLITKNCGLMKAETIKDVCKASHQNPDKVSIGVLVLTDFRLIFKFKDEKGERGLNFVEDYFKIPLFHISKVEKVQDKRTAYDAYPIDVTLKDTRVLRFHIWDKTPKFLQSLNERVNPRDKGTLFNFTLTYSNSIYEETNKFNGWHLYDPIKEYHRQGISEENDLNLRYCYANKDFKLCATYPQVLIEHRDMTDDELKEASQYRTKNRLPVLSYYYKGNKDKEKNQTKKSCPSIWRSSQNKSGLTGTNRSNMDEKLLGCIVSLCAKLFIFDARPYLNALANRVNGGGFENEKHYSNVKLTFCEIENIHNARNALTKLNQLCLSSKIMDHQKFWSSLEATNWYQFVYLLLKYSNEISKTLQDNYSVLIHCSDGWDRSAQLISLSQVLIDPYFRTIEGFAVLIEKDWLSFGHQFGLRNGIYFKEQNEDQISPIFLQWLDCLHQLLHQFPNAFEFNEDLLLFLAKNYTSNLYGTFMFNSEKERVEKEAKINTTSVWTDVMRNISKYKNVYYNSENPIKIITPNYAPYNLHFWSNFFVQNNIYLENNKFYLSDIDRSMTFTNSRMFYEYYKRMDVLKIMNLELKYENMVKVLFDAYEKIKTNDHIMGRLSEDTKAYLEKLKGKIEEQKAKEQKESGNISQSGEESAS